MEEGFQNLEDLERRGHRPVVLDYPGRTGVAHCCLRKGDVTVLSADVRGDGLPMGPIG